MYIGWVTGLYRQQECRNLFLPCSEGDSLHHDRRKRYRSQCRFERRHQFTAYRQQGIMIIIGKRGVLPGYGILFESRRNGEITVNLLFLYGFRAAASLAKMVRHFKGRYGRYGPDNFSRCRSVVLVDDADRNIFHLAVAENRSHKENRE